MPYTIQMQPINTIMTEAQLRQSICCSTYDDEVWFFVDEALRRGDNVAKTLAEQLKGMDVDMAQAYLKQHP